MNVYFETIDCNICNKLISQEIYTPMVRDYPIAPVYELANPCPSIDYDEDCGNWSLCPECFNAHIKECDVIRGDE
jgi:hypothetical protein